MSNEKKGFFAGKDRARKKSRPEGTLTRCMRSLEKLLVQYGHLDAQQAKVCAEKTKATRRKELRRFVREVHSLGFPLLHLKGLKPKHVDAAMKKWEAEGKSASTIQNRLTHIRTLCRWLGKDGMIMKAEHYLEDPSRGRRVYATKELKGCIQKGIDIIPKVEFVAKKEPMCAIQLLVMAAFGLRREEAMKLRPHLADKGTWLAVKWGTKGGRERPQPIDMPVQRHVLDIAKSCVNKKSHSLIPGGYTYDQWESRFQYVVCDLAGLNRKNECPPHTLRHSYAANLYEAVAGHPPPVSGEPLPEGFDPEKDLLARHEVAEHLGHSRRQAASAYIGAMADCIFED